MNLTEIRNQLIKFKLPLLVITGLIIVIIVGLLLTQGGTKPTQFAPEERPKTDLPPYTEDIKGKPVFTSKENRKEISKNATQIKTEIIQKKIGENRGTLLISEQSNYKIEYVPTPDVFLVTIMATPLDDSKREAEEWFTQRGLKTSDLCDFPVRFSLGIKDRTSVKSFDPFPSGCN